MIDVLFSVVIPAYQAESTIGRAIKSALAFRKLPIEVVVVDDGSGDGTAAIVRDLAGDDGRVRLVSQENSGRSSARNTGVASSRGEWVMFLDSDDYLLPGSEDVIARTLGGSGAADLLVFGMVIVGDRRLFTAEVPDADSAMRNHGSYAIKADRLAASMIDGTWHDVIPHASNFEIDTCWARLYRRSMLVGLATSLPPSWGPFPLGVKFSEDRLFNTAYLRAMGRGVVRFEATPIYCWDFGESSTAAVIHAEDGEGLPTYRERLLELADASFLSQDEVAAMYGAQAIEQFRRAIVAPVNPPKLESLEAVWTKALASSGARRDLLSTPEAYLGKKGVWRVAAHMLSNGHVHVALHIYRAAYQLKTALGR